MKKECSHHIITALAFVVFIVLGLACASTKSITSNDGVFDYVKIDYETVRIVKYHGYDTDIIIPAYINKKKVESAYLDKSENFSKLAMIDITSITIPDGVFINTPDFVDYILVNEKGAGTYSRDNSLKYYKDGQLQPKPAIIEGMSTDNEYLGIGNIGIIKNDFYVHASRFRYTRDDKIYFVMKPGRYNYIDVIYTEENVMYVNDKYRTSSYIYDITLEEGKRYRLTASAKFHTAFERTATLGFEEIKN